MRALVIGVGLVLLVCLGGCRRAEQPAVPSSSEQHASGNQSDSAPARFNLPVPDLGYNAREGRAIYSHYCVTCHGEAGHGDGFNAYNLDPKPRDLAEPTFQAKRSNDDLATVIRTGGGSTGFSTAMPPWGRTLNERQIRNVIDYLRTLKQTPD